MTLSKTMLYFIMESVSGFNNVKHNDPYTLVTLYFLPIGAWLLVPTFIIFSIAPLLLSKSSPIEVVSAPKLTKLPANSDKTPKKGDMKEKRLKMVQEPESTPLTLDKKDLEYSSPIVRSKSRPRSHATELDTTDTSSTISKRRGRPRKNSQ